MTSGRLIVTMRSRASSTTVQKRYSVMQASRTVTVRRCAPARWPRKLALPVPVGSGTVACRPQEGRAPMKLSTDRILTTHVGSLPRPPDLLAMLEAREAGHAFDEAAFEARLAAAVHEIVEKQVAC